MISGIKRVFSTKHIIIFRISSIKISFSTKHLLCYRIACIKCVFSTTNILVYRISSITYVFVDEISTFFWMPLNSMENKPFNDPGTLQGHSRAIQGSPRIARQFGGRYRCETSKEGYGYTSANPTTRHVITAYENWTWAEPCRYVCRTALAKEVGFARLCGGSSTPPAAPTGGWRLHPWGLNMWETKAA